MAILIRSYFFKDDDEFIEFQKNNPLAKIHTVVPIGSGDHASGVHSLEGKVDVVHNISHGLFVTVIEETINPLIRIVGKIHNGLHKEAISALEDLILEK